ncbi:DUF1206 domain-containing protein [Demequina aurantiaca]|uniref:DUF1206 domain-containing protein n=1 Tax=Demequina aurantiaca TaxID=676200 RepID=UPI0007846F5B|nr:DUF1206 domain-containing protein [Demequina aurantiaca]
MTTSHTSEARSGSSGDAWEIAARGGYFVSGVLHIFLGFIVAKIGFGSGGEADQSTALSSIGDAPLGNVILWISAVAFIALGAWQLADVFHSGQEAKDRAKAAGKAVLYGALAYTTISIAMGSGGSDGDEQSEGFASSLMSAPAGRFLVGAVGLGIIGGAVYHVYKGWTKKFLEDLRGTGGRELSKAVRTLGTIGYIAKGAALGVVGVLFTYAAITADPDKAKGLDGAVETLLGAPGGQILVVLVGIGFAAYGLYSFARARYARM